MKNEKLKYLFGGLLIFSLLVSVFAGVNLVRQRQLVGKRAAVPGGTATLSFSGPITSEVGAVLAKTINVFSPDVSSTKGIIGIKSTLIYQYLSAENPLALTPADIVGMLPSPWSYVRKDVTTSGTTLTIIVEAIYLQPGENGYLGASTAPEPYVLLNFAARREGTASLEFQASKSEVRSKNGNLDILNQDLPRETYAIGGVPTLTPSPTGQPTVTPTATPTPSCPGGDKGNLNCDSQGLINTFDLSILLGSWAPFGPVPTPSPGNHSADLPPVDGHVDSYDLSTLLGNWKPFP